MHSQTGPRNSYEGLKLCPLLQILEILKDLNSVKKNQIFWKIMFISPLTLHSGENNKYWQIQYKMLLPLQF